MKRILVRITASNVRQCDGLVGQLGIAYEDTSIANLIRLSPEARKIHYWSTYIRRSEVSIERIRPTTFDDFKVEA